MTDRVALFIDYQNVYMRAREAFVDHWPEYDYTIGQVDPVKLGEHIIACSPGYRKLTHVGIYRGKPSNKHDPKGYGASRKQAAFWERDPRVNVHSRPIRYPRGWPDECAPGAKPGEKGVDVALAIDFAAMAVRRQFDIGIIFSGDTDLLPALEFVDSDDIPARVEVAAWDPSNGHRKRLRFSNNGGRPYCHWLDKAVFEGLSDRTNYTR